MHNECYSFKIHFILDFLCIKWQTNILHTRARLLKFCVTTIPNVPFYIYLCKSSIFLPTLPPSWYVNAFQKVAFLSFRGIVTAQCYSSIAQWHMTKMRVDRKLSICITADLCTLPKWYYSSDAVFHVCFNFAFVVN